MDAAEALADLTEISNQIEAAVIATPDGGAVASTLPDAATAAVAGAAADVLRGAGESAVSVEASTREGSFFVARDSAHVVAAVTRRGVPSGLVLYDLQTCLRRLGEESEPPEPKRRKRQTDAAA